MIEIKLDKAHESTHDAINGAHGLGDIGEERDLIEGLEGTEHTLETGEQTWIMRHIG